MRNKNNIIPLHSILYSIKNKYNAANEMSQNILGARIAEARKNAGLSLVAFSKVLTEYGIYISGGSINKWELGDTLPNGYQLLALCHALGIEDIRGYFSAGYKHDLDEVGMRKLMDYKADLIATGKYTPSVKEDNDNIRKSVDVPISDLPVSASTGDFLDEGNFEMVSFPIRAVLKGTDFGVHVNGDSMEPVYLDGQIVWGKQCSELKPGDVGIFIYDGDGYIKEYDE